MFHLIGVLFDILDIFSIEDIACFLISSSVFINIFTVGTHHFKLMMERQKGAMGRWVGLAHLSKNLVQVHVGTTVNRFCDSSVQWQLYTNITGYRSIYYDHSVQRQLGTKPNGYISNSVMLLLLFLYTTVFYPKILKDVYILESTSVINKVSSYSSIR